jgi:hypothetical protein
MSILRRYLRTLEQVQAHRDAGIEIVRLSTSDAHELLAQFWQLHELLRDVELDLWAIARESDVVYEVLDRIEAVVGGVEVLFEELSEPSEPWSEAFEEESDD